MNVDNLRLLSSALKLKTEPEHFPDFLLSEEMIK